jgi:NADH-quinone oxidoreductase subunit J
MYTFYFLQFVSAGLILLVGMIGAIVLTLIVNPKQNVKNQDIYRQLSRQLKTAIFLTKINHNLHH